MQCLLTNVQYSSTLFLGLVFTLPFYDGLDWIHHESIRTDSKHLRLGDMMGKHNMARNFV